MMTHSFCKKHLLLNIIFFIITLNLFATPIENVKQLTLENGMDVFLLEDPSDALVHIEYTCRAGTSSQSYYNSGFFKLYTNLIKENNPSLNFTNVLCTQDSSRYFLTVTSPQTEKTLTVLADAIFNPSFSNEIITTELEKLKSKVKEATEDMSVYINSAIDSKVFSDSPWKHDSGIYPSLFKQLTADEARVQIKNISDSWYTPQNSALFISGNIDEEKLQIVLENTFGKYYSSSINNIDFNSVIKVKSNPNENKKFVLHSPTLSPDITQVVVQYKNLGTIECKLLTEILNNNNSSFKNKLLSFDSLNILGNEYIDVSTNSERNSSRLIFQTLIQPPTNKNTSTNSVNQTIEFYTQIKDIESLITEEEFNAAKASLLRKFNNSTKDIVSTMDSISNFWAVAPYYESIFDSSLVKEEQHTESSLTATLMQNQINKIKNIEFSTSFASTMKEYNSEEPFVFVIINSDDYEKNKVAYSIAGFEEITPENSSWYVQEMYKEIRSQLEINQMPSYVQTSYNPQKSKTKDNQYYEKNVNQIKAYELKNGIKVISKEKKDSANMTLLISIDGGKLNSAINNGFEEMMITLLTNMIENSLNIKWQSKEVKYPFTIDYNVDISTSSILLEFQKEDAFAILETIKDVIIYGEIPPAMADKAVTQKRYKKRLANGSVKNQMLSTIIDELYGKGSAMSNIYDAKNEILTNTSYMSILSEYHKLLDTSRYNLIMCGDFDKEIFDILDKTIGEITLPVIDIYEENEIATTLTFPVNKSVKIPLVHTFLTDIPAEEAGPQPAVLIPTTEFLDPVMYVIEAPVFGTKDSAIYKGMLKYLEVKLQEEINKVPVLSECKVSIMLPENKMNYATVIFLNVSHTNEIEPIYKSTISKIIDDLSFTHTNENTIQSIKDNWTLKELLETTSNTGTANLIHQGFEQFPDAPRPTLYLEEYNYIQNASISDFEKIMNYLISPVSLKVYSEDSKK